MELNEETIMRILTSTDHRDLTEAILADAVDAIPFIGDATNTLRLKNLAEQRGNDTALLLQGIDFIIGLAPVAGDVADILTPTNTLLYLMEKGGK